MDRRLVLHRVDELEPLRLNVLARGRDSLAAAVERAIPALHCVAQVLVQHVERGAAIAGNEQIGVDLLERIALQQRIGRNADDLGVLARAARLRNPRHRAFQHHHDVGLGQERRRLEAHVHRAVGRQVEIARFGLHHRNGERFRERGKLRNRIRIAADRRCQDERELCLGDHRRGFLDRLTGRRGRGNTEWTYGVTAHAGGVRRQHLARQRQVDRALRLAHGDIQCTVDYGTDGLAGAQLVIPFDEFAHHAALVEALLAPMDGAVARGDAAAFGERGAAGRQQDRDIVAGGIHQPADGVGGADRDVHHHGGGLAAGAVIAVCHRHGDVFMRDHHEAGDLPAGTLVARQRFHDRCEIGAGIGKDMLDAALAEPGQVGFRGHGLGAVGHGLVHPLGLKGPRYRPSHPCQFREPSSRGGGG